jgi:HlyD family secretion protein
MMGLRPKPIPVEIGKVSEGTLRATVNEEGRTRIRQRYTVYAPVAGQLRRLPFKAGATVRAGETVVAVLDPLPSSLLDARSRILAEARRDTAAAQLAKAREALRFAALELQRFQKLYADRTVSAQELEGVQWREAAATKETTAAESALRQAEAELAEFEAAPASVAAGVPPAVEGGVSPPGVLDSATPYQPNLPPGETPAATKSAKRQASANPPVEVRAPISGQVLRVPEESARVVSPGTPLLELGDPADLEVVIEVLSRDGAAIRPGAVVELHHWGGETPLEARVRLVEPAAFTKVSALGVEEQRVNVIADLVTPPDQRPGLGDRFRVEARIVVWESPRTLKAPTGGVFRKGADWAAFTLRDGKTVLQPVQIGRSSGTEVQILSGLKDGEEIVLYPGDRIRENVRVRPVVISP